MGRAPLLGAACPRTPSTEQNSILQLVLQALRPAPPARARFHPGIGIYGALHAPKPPWSLSDERKEPKLAGETPVPLFVRHNGCARKIFLKGFPTSSKRFFRCRGFPRGAARSPLFEITSPRPRGIFKGAQPTGVGRSGFSCVARVAFPLKCALWPQGKQSFPA